MPTQATDPDGLKTRVCCRLLAGLGKLVFRQRHCFIVISENPEIAGGATTVYSLFPVEKDGRDIGTPVKNDPRDKVPLEKGKATCYDVPDCNAKREKGIDSNYLDAGLSRDYKPRGPNSNSYVVYQLSLVGATPPKIDNAPGYDHD
jgi:hypothetical protein